MAAITGTVSLSLPGATQAQVIAVTWWQTFDRRTSEQLANTTGSTAVYCTLEILLCQILISCINLLKNSLNFYNIIVHCAYWSMCKAVKTSLAATLGVSLGLGVATWRVESRTVRIRLNDSSRSAG